MNSTWLKRLGAASGVLYVILLFLKNDGDNSPNFHASQQEILAWAKSVQISPAFWIGPYTALLGLLLFMVFVIYLSSFLRQAEGGWGWLSAVAFGSGMITVAVKLAAFPISAAAAVRANDGFNPQILAILWDMNNISFFITLVTQAFLLAATAIVILGTKALPGWLGWSAALFALILLGGLPVAFFNAVPLQLLPLIWVLVTSIVLIIRVRKPIAYLQNSMTQHPKAQTVGAE